MKTVDADEHNNMTIPVSLEPIKFLGVPEIDIEHLAIAEALSDIYISLLDRAVTTMVIDKLAGLADLICEHFEHEENLMRTIRHNKAWAHKLDHDHILDRMSRFVIASENGRGDLIENAVTLIGAWKVVHVKEFDEPLAKAIRKSRKRPTWVC